MKVTVVSHYPKIGDSPETQVLRRSLAQFDKKEIDEAHLEHIKDEVTAQVIREQVEAGVEIITDGQIRWEDPVTYIARKIKGFRIAGLHRYFDTNTFYRQPVCEGALTPSESLVVKDFQFCNALSSVPVKAVLTGPFTLAKLSEDHHYANFEKLAMNLASILGEETQRLEQAGAGIVQFDEPALLNFKEDFPVFKKVWTELAGYFPDTLEVILFLNFGDLGGIYPEILELPFTTLGADLFDEHANWGILNRVPVSKKIMAGIADARNTKMETEESLQKKLERLLTLAPAANLLISPNYGLEFLPREVAKKKLMNLSKIVREFRESQVKA